LVQKYNRHLLLRAFCAGAHGFGFAGCTRAGLHDAHKGGSVLIQCDYYAVMFYHFPFALQKTRKVTTKNAHTQVK
jgi:hypothetical protein